ncbi:hypothetical protein MIN45_P0843 [Methylomarinovum tepidoasis]|uniref:EAL domain-containing protein n=1 Tax=Methylomarinovum tepidoasis TaxID=2840183 RepID=A0AAU9C5M3_9GAMM|nr:EAL domain-containing protein [Methylomarinovum sp. IN45]BCX88474.1 hypothetical protein MIN45_P0843 [Methylomarinovum sp. IN45]
MSPSFSVAASHLQAILESLTRFQRDYGGLIEQLESTQRERLHTIQETFLKHLLNGVRVDGDALARVFLDLALPFDLLLGSLNHLKAEVLRYETVAGRQVEHDEALQAFGAINQIFSLARNQAAEVYLRVEVRRPLLLEKAQMRSKMLIRLCFDWLAQINDAILNDLTAFPLTPAKDSPFAKALYYPESLLICLDMKVCDQLQERHRLLLQNAAILYAMLTDRRFEAAYLLYREIRRQLAELLDLLGVLYFESQTNRVQTFFKFLQGLLFLPRAKYLGVINLKELTRINQVYGIEAGDRCITLLEQCLNQVFERHAAWMVFTRGIAGDFYLACYGADGRQVGALLAEIEDCLKQCSEALPYQVSLRSVAIRFDELKEMTTENMHLVIRYLSQLARRHHNQVLESFQDQSAMWDWVRAQYRQTLDIRSRLQASELEIFVQPLMSLETWGELHAFEVLGRFREGDGYLSAGLFIDTLVEMGLVQTFDHLVLQRIIAQRETLAQLTRRLFINVSAASLEDESYLKALKAALQGPLAGFEVVLELTEQVLLENLELICCLHHRYDMIFASDDFGSGYSSLQTVIELALGGGLRYLKIDGSLIRQLGENPASERIVRIVHQMAQELELKTVAEYVETQTQLDSLRQVAVDFGQGYLLGVPDRVEVWLSKRAYLQSRSQTEAPPVLFS